MKKYLPTNIRSLYEEILDRNRKKLNKFRKGEDVLQKTKASYVKRSTFDTVFKVIGHRKNANSLKTGIYYILNKRDENYSLENELGEKISLTNIKEEIKRFNLLKDEDNLKKRWEHEFKARFNNDTPVGPSFLQRSYSETTKLQQEKHAYLKNRQICHAVFSLPNDYNDPNKLHDVMRDALKDILIGHKYIFVIDTSTKNTHCHIYFKSRNEITENIIRTDKKLLYYINQELNNRCLKNGLNLERAPCKDIPLEIKDKKLIPRWIRSYNNNVFQKITADNQTYAYLASKGIKEPDQQNLFLNMYIENKRLAIKVAKTNPILFNLNDRIELNGININVITNPENNSLKPPKILKFHREKTPNWVRMCLKKEFQDIEAKQETLDKLKEIGMNDYNIKSFLHMYTENKNLAIWTLTKRSSVFEITLPENFKFSDIIKIPQTLKVHKEKLPNWIKMHENGKFEDIEANQETLDKLKEIGMNDYNIKSFLHMYTENKNLAIWTINKKSSIFEISTPKNFTLRKVKIKNIKNNILEENEKQ